MLLVDLTHCPVNAGKPHRHVFGDGPINHFLVSADWAFPDSVGTWEAPGSRGFDWHIGMSRMFTALERLVWLVLLNYLLR